MLKYKLDFEKYAYVCGIVKESLPCGPSGIVRRLQDLPNLYVKDIPGHKRMYFQVQYVGGDTFHASWGCIDHDKQMGSREYDPAKMAKLLMNKLRDKYIPAVKIKEKSGKTSGFDIMAELQNI